ncbi:TIGR03086 family metal-binding protein [Nocardioides hungaricus]
MGTLDFAPVTTAVAALVDGVRDDQLGNPTPCPDYTVADLLDHLNGLCLAFTSAARQDGVAGEPSADGSRLPDGWRAEISGRLATLADAWTDPSAYSGLTMAGPIEMPGEIAALVALNEVVVHGWDLAVATGQPYDPDEATVLACLGFVSSFEVPEGAGEGPFGPAVPVAEDAPAPPAATPAGPPGRAAEVGSCA